jgi:hypothetical protein
MMPTAKPQSKRLNAGAVFLIRQTVLSAWALTKRICGAKLPTRFGFWAKQPSSKTRQCFPKHQRISLEKDETSLPLVSDLSAREVSDLVWEIFRLRRLKWTLLAATVEEGLIKVLVPFLGWGEGSFLAKAWVARKPSAIKRVEKILASADLNMDAAMAQTLSLKLDDIERIDCMIVIAEAAATPFCAKLIGIVKCWARTCFGPCRTSRMVNLVIENTSAKGQNAYEQRPQDKIK